MKFSTQSFLQFQLLALCVSQAVGQDTNTGIAANKKQPVLVEGKDQVDTPIASLSANTSPQDLTGHSAPIFRPSRTLKKRVTGKKKKSKVKTKKVKSKVKPQEPASGSVLDPTQGIVLEATAKDPDGVREVTFRLSLNDGPIVSHTAVPSDTEDRFEVNLLDLAGGDYKWTVVMETLTGEEKLSVETEFQVLDVEVQDPVAAPVVRGLQPDCSVIDNDKFTICLDLDYPEDTSQEFLDAFGIAKAKFESVVTNSMTTETFTMSEARHGNVVATTVPDFPINDLYIAASAGFIDGPGDVVATAGPVDGRRVNGFVVPIVGMVRIDAQDIDSMLANGDLQETLMHEIAHILGIGTIWKENLLHSGNDGDDQYHGVNALREWRNIGCSGDLPVETDFGDGTALGHWDEECLDHEMLTGIAHASRPDSQKLSKMTVGALADLGYDVNYDAADEYTLADLGTCNANGKNYCPEHQDPVSRKLRSSPRKSRKLSESGLRKAKFAAAKELKARREQHSTVADAEGELYFGTDLLTVYVMEEEEIKITMVTWDDVKDIAERL